MTLSEYDIPKNMSTTAEDTFPIWTFGGNLDNFIQYAAVLSLFLLLIIIIVCYYLSDLSDLDLRCPAEDGYVYIDIRK